jgi:uncharacterized protein
MKSATVAKPPALIYVHGFNSSAASFKANLLRAKLASLKLEQRFDSPSLAHRPAQAMQVLERLLVARGAPNTVLVGSSLGGFYATYLVEKHGCKAVLVNPAINAHEGLRAYLGPQKNLYTGAEYELTEQHLDELNALYVSQLRRIGNYLLLVQTGDEVLDYREALARYQGAGQIVIEGGDHAFRDFENYLDKILAFAGIETRHP